MRKQSANDNETRSSVGPVRVILLSALIGSLVSWSIAFVVTYPLGTWWQRLTSRPKIRISLLRLSPPTAPRHPRDKMLVADVPENLRTATRRSLWSRELARLESIDSLKLSIDVLTTKLASVEASLECAREAEAILSAVHLPLDVRLNATRKVLTDRLLPAAMFEAVRRQLVQLPAEDAGGPLVKVSVDKGTSKDLFPWPSLTVEYSRDDREVVPIAHVERALSMGDWSAAAETLAQVIRCSKVEPLVQCVNTAASLISQEARAASGAIDSLNQLVLLHGTWSVQVYYLNDGGRPGLVSPNAELKMASNGEELVLPLIRSGGSLSSISSTMLTMMDSIIEPFVGVGIQDLQPPRIREETLSKIRRRMEEEAHGSQEPITVEPQDGCKIDYICPVFEADFPREVSALAALRLSHGCECVFSTLFESGSVMISSESTRFGPQD